jgi:hypothetical protein
MINVSTLFIIFQNIDLIKVENDMDGLSEETSIAMKTVEVYLPSTFSVKKAEPKVSLVF